MSFRSKPRWKHDNFSNQALDLFVMSDEKAQIEQIGEAFEQEFGRFADLRLDDVVLIDAEALLQLADMLRHTGLRRVLALRGGRERALLVGRDEQSDIAQTACHTTIPEFVWAAPILAVFGRKAIACVHVCI